MSDRHILRDEDGIALTEYLALVGLLAGAVIVAVVTFGTSMSDKWESWSRFATGLVPEQSVAAEAAVLAAETAAEEEQVAEEDNGRNCVRPSGGACLASEKDKNNK